MKNKTELRTNAKDMRKNLNITELSSKAVMLIKENILYKKSKNVMLFYPTKYEIDLRGLLSDNKNFYLPRVHRQNLEVCPYKIGDKLEKSKLNIEEPITEPISPDVLDLVIVPALMADKNGYRLGYGGGFYDRFLSDKHARTLCVIPKEFHIEKLPTDNFDKKIDEIIVI